MSLLAGIVPSERWGIGEVAPRGWKLYFKGGWGYGTGLLDHQVVLLVRGCARVSIAVLTMYDGSHPYGKETLKGIFERLLRGLPTPKRRSLDRGARIRTGDLKHPKLARYQAALRPAYRAPESSGAPLNPLVTGPTGRESLGSAPAWPMSNRCGRCTTTWTGPAGSRTSSPRPTT